MSEHICVCVCRDKGGGVFITVFRFCLQFVGPALKIAREVSPKWLTEQASFASRFQS